MGLEGRWLQAVTSALTICLLSVSQGEASLVNARQGESAELSCNVIPDSKERTTPNLFPLHVVEWVRLGFTVPILIKFGVYTPRVHPNYKGRVSLTPDASLLVERLTLEDEGWFECRILVLDTEKDDFKNGTWTFLSITAPPVFIKTPPTIVEVLLGDSLTLSCGAHGNPRPTIVWHKDDSQIEKHEKIKVVNGTLSLASVTRNISGVYKCHVSNLEGNLTHSTQLQVKGPPIIIISPEDTTLNMSQDAVLQCQADAYPSNLTYEWLKQGQNVYHIDSLRSRVKILVDGTLLIPNLIPDDAGNYTCIPTNGILTPPSASAHLTVKHPARVGRMPRETYLPTGLEGVIVCPVQADPPVLYVNWTKDGNNLNLDKYPGWLINSEGSVFITATTDNAVGMYTCTAYNSYGTMGQSEPTQVILQDPPSFRVLPRPEYLQEVGRELMIPCEGSGEPSPTITWSKIGPSPRSQYTVLTNGSLLLKPVNKDHHGGWECLATNRVATVSAGTVVVVLGTSPHAVSSVSVTTEMNQANVSWVPGFDGGYTQKYTVWVKQASRGKHEWASLPVPTSKNYLLVTGLLAGTTYQFSVLPQNKVGSGPFSEIVSVRMQAVPTEKPTALAFVPVLDPPILLSANQTENGVLLQWSPPEAPAFPLTGYVLQARRDQSQWVILSSSINANQTELLVQGLLRNCNYGLRLMSRSHIVLSEPSESVNVSTFGIEIYPLSSTFLEDILPPLLAGVIAGVCFLIVAIILSFVTACYMSHRREHRRKRRQYLPSTFQTNVSPTTRSPPHSPDSVLKLKLCPPLPFFPNSSSSQSDQSSFDKGSRGEYHDQRKQLLSNSSPPPHYTPLFESHLGSQGPSPVALESISRGPDGRFIVQPRGEGSSPSNKNKLKEDILQMNGGASGSGSNGTPFRESPKSSIFSSEKGERKNSTLTVDVPELSKLPSSPGRVRAMARNFSRHGCFYSDDEQGTEALLERASFYSDNSEKKPSNSHRRHQVPGYTEDLFPKLYRKNKPMERRRPYHSDYHPIESQLTNNSTMISQLDCELERGSINNCIQLAKERKLERYLDQGHGRNNLQSNNRESLQKEILKSEEEPVWKLQDVTMRQKHMLSGQTGQVSYSRRACYFGDTSSPLDHFPKSCIQWDISPVTSVTKLVPVQSPQETRSPKSQHPQTCRETSEDSLVVDLSCSQVTQNTSLQMLSTATTSEGSTPAPSVQNTESVRFLSSQTVVEQDSRERTLDGGFAPRSRFSYAGCQPLTSTTKGVSVYSESPGISDCASYNLCERNTVADYRATRDPSPSVFSALPCDLHEVGAKAKEKETQTRDDGHGSGFCSYLEKEGVRTQSRRSDKCLFSDCSSPISTLTLVEGADNDQSQFSVPEMAKARGPSSKMSPLQTSAILEYLSLPGFIEMSVDEPVEDAEVTNTTEQSSEPKSEKSPGTKPDVVLKNWQAHGQENQEMASIPNSFFEQTHSASPVESRFYSNPKQIYKPSLPGNRKDSTLRVRFTNEIRPSSTGLEKNSKQLYDEKTQIRAVRTNSDIPGSRSAHTFFSAAKGVADIVSKHSQSCVSNSQSLLEQSQRHASQGSRTNNIASRICQAPVPFLKKSLSVGPCRTLSSMVDPHPFLKKSLSLGSQKLEHFESPRVYISEKCYWDELPNPDFKSDGLRRTPSSSPRPGPSWREYIPFRRPIRSTGSLERLGHTQRSLASPSYLSSPMYPPRQTSVSPLLEPADPQRQAAVFLESPRWSPSYQDMLRSAQHKYIPMPSAIHVPQYQHWPGPRGESMRPMDPRRGTPRSYIPRGISWPSTHYPPVPASEGESYRLPDRITARGGDADIQEGWRSSYTSQSSGRGSAGLFRQSLSITPTLLSSPETTEYERHRAEMELPERRANRRNTSVDESYEWDSADACVDAEVLDAMRFDQSHSNGFQRGRVELRRDQAPGLQDHQQKGLPPSLSPPVSKSPRYQYSCSLSEVHFNSLRQEYQEYRRAQASMRSCEPCLTTGNGSDSDSNSALL